MKNVKVSDWFKKNLTNTRLGLLKCSVNYTHQTDFMDVPIQKLISIKKEELQVVRENSIPVVQETRNAYKVCGKEPSRYRPSSEALLRRIRTDKGLYRINNIVDTINFLSISSSYSIGGFDYDQIDGDIVLELGDSASYEAIGRGELNIEFMPGLKDDKGFFGTPTSDSVRTMVTPATQNLLLVYYDFYSNEKLLQTLDSAEEYLKQFCGAKNMTSLILS